MCLTEKEEALIERGLPKWPQMLVTGTKIDPTAALEIIRRTDDFFMYQTGNDHRFIDEARKLCHMPDYYGDSYEAFVEWQEKWGVIETEYVENSWVSCSFVGGPHGWCHPDGTIGYTNNVGKWPSIREIYGEWKTLAEHFPFIEVEATLMDGAEFEKDTKPVVSMLVRNGKVTLIDPEERNLHEEFGRVIPESRDFYGILPRLIIEGPEAVEHAISLQQIAAWGEDFLKKNPSCQKI